MNDIGYHFLKAHTNNQYLRMTNNLLLIEPFHDQIKGVCKVKNGATLMNIVRSDY